MGIGDVLARCAAGRTHVLLAEAPGDWTLRALVERRMLSLGWCPALSPADADVLAVCGIGGGPEFAGNVDLIWDQMPGPRARIEVGDAEAVDSALNRAATELLDTRRQRRDAAQRSRSVDRWLGDGSAAAESPGGHRHSTGHDMGHGSHQHMDHPGMDMAPRGIALAEGGQDRDGLEMDVLHLSLGPVLAHWPSGLVLRCSLQGDVIADAEAWAIDADRSVFVPAAEQPAPLVAARECDHIVDLLALAGWPSAADHARQIRDLLLDESAPVDHAQLKLERLLRTLRRSWLLRWSLRDLAPLSVGDLERYRLPAALAGDSYDRLLARVDHALAALSNGLAASPIRADFSAVSGALPGFVCGLELATARLVVASLGIDITATGPCSHG